MHNILSESLMENLLAELPIIKDKFAMEPIICPKKYLGTLGFLCGFLYSRTQKLDEVYMAVELLLFLSEKGKINSAIQEHILYIGYSEPEKMEQLLSLLHKLASGENVQLFLELEKLESAKVESLQENTKCDIEKSDELKPASTVELPPTIMLPPKSHEQDRIIDEQQRSSGTQKYDEDYFKKMAEMHEQSQALAKKLQEEEDNLVKADKVDEQIVCLICYVGLYDQQFQPLQKCEHVFHKNCLSEAFKAQISENNFPLICPHNECMIEVQDRDINQILESALYQKYQKHTLKFYADMHGDQISWCPTVNCEYMFFFQKDDETRFTCPECKKEYCLNCQAEWHWDMTCKEFKVSNTHSEADDQFLSFVKGKKFKQCPKCKFWVERTLGCDHMTCKCKFEFCYKCGGIFGKCECIAKMHAENQRRRQAQEARRQKKMERMQRMKKKKPAPPPTSSAKNTRSKKSR